MSNKVNIFPILKWAGGKRKLVNEILKRIPRNFNVYYEPFLGGGAVFLALQPKKAVLNDLNVDLINVYTTIKNSNDELVSALKIHKEKHCKEYYYSIRSHDRDGTIETYTNVQKAARFIYLNHTCYNGLYRVNSKGQFNTPMGVYKNPKILNENNLINVSEYFNDNEIVFKNGNYYDVLEEAKEGDFVYLDPPYEPVSITSSFTMYTKDGFSREKQIELKKCCDELNSKGVKFLQSNSDTEFIRELYKDYYIEIVQMPRMINSKGNRRQNVNEVLISNYK